MIPLETGPLEVEEKKQEPEVQPEVRSPTAKRTPAVLVPRSPSERQLQTNRMHAMCRMLDVPVPLPDTPEEKILRSLERRYYKNIQCFLRDRIDAKTLPLVVEAMHDANIPREQKFMEIIRHYTAYAVTLIVQPILGGIGVLAANIAGAFVSAISHAPIVMGTAMVVFLLHFFYKAYQYSQTTQALSGAVLGNILGWSVLWAVAAGLLAGLLQALVKYFKRLQEQKAAEEGWGSE